MTDVGTGGKNVANRGSSSQASADQNPSPRSSLLSLAVNNGLLQTPAKIATTSCGKKCQKNAYDKESWEVQAFVSFSLR